MNFTYDAACPIRCRVSAPPVGFGEGGRVVFARQFSGKGTTSGDETRRSRKAAFHAPVQGRSARGPRLCAASAINPKSLQNAGGVACPR